MAIQISNENISGGIIERQVNTHPVFLHIFVAVYAFMVSIFSIFGNVMTIYILKRQTKYSQQIRIYRIQLAMSHIVSPAATYWMLIVSSLQGTWIFGDFGCAFYAFLQSFCAYFSILVVAAIAFNRATTLKAVGSTPMNETVRNSVILWTISFALSAPPIFGWNRFVIEGLGTTCSVDLHATDWASRAFVIYILNFGFIVPLAVIFFSYHRVCGVLFKSAIFRQQSKFQIRIERSRGDAMNRFTPVPNTSPKLSSNLSLLAKLLVIWRDRRNFKHLIRPLRTVLMVTVCFACAWLPYATLAVVGQFASFRTVGPYANAAAALVAKSYIAFNPIVYVLTDETFRRRLSDILRRVDK